MSFRNRRSGISRSWTGQQARIGSFIDTRLMGAENVRLIGKPLDAAPKNFWSYRVGDYRLVCELRDDVLVVLVVDIGHRSDIYR